MGEMADDYEDRAMRDFDKLTERPKCPWCNKEMIRTHIECHDQSGWMHGWACACKKSEEKNFNPDPD